MQRKLAATTIAKWAPPVLGLVACLLLTSAYLRPIWRVGGSHIAPTTGDPVFNLWVLSWGAHQVRAGLPSFWDANIFYPTRGTLTFSDHLIGPAAQLALFETVVPNPIAGYNFLFFTSFVASTCTTAWVLRRSGRSWTVAFLAGWMFAFSPFRQMHMNHVQILLGQWIPLTLWLWDRFLTERTAKAGGLFLLVYLLHVTGGCYLAYMIHVPLLAILAVRLPGHGRALLAPRSLRLLLPMGLIAGAVLAALFLPYVRTSHRLEISRAPEEAASFAATTASWLSPAHRNVYGANIRQMKALRRQLGPLAKPFLRTENSLFAGILPTCLFLVGMGGWLRERWVSAQGAGFVRRALLGALLALAAAAWIWGDLLTLATPEDRPGLFGGLGRFGWEAPALVLAVALAAWYALRRLWVGPLLRRPAEDADDTWERGIALGGLLCFALAHATFYVPLMKVVPGLDGMRVPARFAAFVSFALVVFAARGADRLLARLRGRKLRAAVAAAMVLFLAVELWPKGIRWVALLRPEQFPAVYQWLARREDVQALLELPIRQNSRETAAMYASTLHWKPIANGFSGYMPQSHEEITRRMRWVPDREGVAFLRTLGISHLLIHRDEIAEEKEPVQRLLARFERELAAGPAPEVELVWSDPRNRVYRILPSSRTPSRAGW